MLETEKFSHDQNPDMSDHRGFFFFSLLMMGVTISTLGVCIENIAFEIWVYKTTNSIIKIGYLLVAITVPMIVFAPYAGTILDRWNMRRTLIVTQLASAFCSLILYYHIVYFKGSNFWMTFALVGLNNIFFSFLFPAVSVFMTLLIPKKSLSRAGGYVYISDALAEVLSPVSAAIIYMTFSIAGVLLLGAAASLISVAILLVIPLPYRKIEKRQRYKFGDLTRDMLQGWQYISVRKGLVVLVLFFMIWNFFRGMLEVLITPIILSFTTPMVYGMVITISAGGMVVASLLGSRWMHKNNIHVIFRNHTILGIAAIVTGLYPSAILISVTGFVLYFCLMRSLGSAQNIWQTKVEAKYQGRVLAIRRMLQWSLLPLAYLIIGPLTQYYIEPLFIEGGYLATSLGKVFGTGLGRGSAFLFSLMGLFTLLLVFFASLSQTLTHVETNLPDVSHEARRRPRLVKKIN